jgi:hypothetical protein
MGMDMGKVMVMVMGMVMGMGMGKIKKLKLNLLKSKYSFHISGIPGINPQTIKLNNYFYPGKF